MNTQTAPKPPRSGRVVVVVFVAAVLLVGGYFALGMPGMDHGGDTSPHEGMAMPAERGTFTTLSTDDFAAGMGNPGVVLVNVHVPYEREIAGTDAFVPYDGIVGDRLPADKNSYLEELITRDVPALSARRDPVRLRRYFEVLAASTAGMPTDATLYNAGGVDAKTAAAYESLLAALFVYDEVPAYSHNRLARLSKGKKRYLVDPALVGAALRVGADEVLDDPDLFGRLVDTFAMSQLRAEVALAARPYQPFHVREGNGRHEVDLVIDLGRRGLVAVEFKAAAAVRPTDAVHLAWMRDRMGRRFLAGAVLHTGTHTHELCDRLITAPISTLWG